MKKPLSRMLEIFSGRDRSEKTNAIRDRYCACGAFKPEAVRPQGELSFKTHGHTPGPSEKDRLASTKVTYGPSRELSNKRY